MRLLLYFLLLLPLLLPACLGHSQTNCPGGPVRVQNATCLRMDAPADSPDRFYQILCSTDHSRVGQVNYLDNQCQNVSAVTTVSEGICMECTDGAEYTTYLPKFEALGSVQDHGQMHCDGTYSDVQFAADTCYFFQEPDGTWKQQSYECDGINGWLRTYSHTNGTCTGQPDTTETRGINQCFEDRRVFTCSVPPPAAPTSAADAQTQAPILWVLALAAAVKLMF
jgi:hypothetical protein